MLSERIGGRRAKSNPPLGYSAAFRVIRSRKRLAQPAMPFCSLRSKARLSASTSRVITEPAPTIAPAPITTGATRAVLEPMKAPSPISVRCLPKPSKLQVIVPAPILAFDPTEARNDHLQFQWLRQISNRDRGGRSSAPTQLSSRPWQSVPARSSVRAGDHAARRCGRFALERSEQKGIAGWARRFRSE